MTSTPRRIAFSGSTREQRPGDVDRIMAATIADLADDVDSPIRRLGTDPYEEEDDIHPPAQASREILPYWGSRNTRGQACTRSLRTIGKG